MSRRRAWCALCSAVVFLKTNHCLLQARTLATPAGRSRFQSTRCASGRQVQQQVHVLACATEYRQETAILQRSAARNGFRFHTVGLGEPWRGFATKFLAYEKRLQELRRKLPPDQLVMLLDAWDTVILGSSEELVSKMSRLPSGSILCGAERVCGPNHFLVAQIEELYPDGHTPWRYPNSGGLVGPLQVMLELLHALVHDTESGTLSAEENDQVRLHDFLIARAGQGRPFPLFLDTDCQVFQCMYEEQPQWDSTLAGSIPRLQNRLTGAKPVVAHGNGHTGRWFLSAMYSEMKLLDHLGLRMDELQHLKHEMPVPPGTEVTEEIKAEYCPWWYMPGMHKGATDGFATFRSIREMLCRNIMDPSDVVGHPTNGVHIHGLFLEGASWEEGKGDDEGYISDSKMKDRKLHLLYPDRSKASAGNEPLEKWQAFHSG